MGQNNSGSQNDISRQVLEQLDLEENDDIVTENRPFTSLNIGSILDARDYLDSWHLSIVIDEDGSNPNLSKTLHFLPFTKANRDERFTPEDQDRLAPAFSKQEAKGDPEQQISVLKAYLNNHRQKTGATQKPARQPLQQN